MIIIKLNINQCGQEVTIDANYFQVDADNNLCLGIENHSSEYESIAIFKKEDWVYCVMDDKQHNNPKIEKQQAGPFHIELRRTVPRNVYGLQFEGSNRSFWIADFYSDTQAYRIAANLNDAWLKKG